LRTKNLNHSHCLLSGSLHATLFIRHLSTFILYQLAKCPKVFKPCDKLQTARLPYCLVVQFHKVIFSP